MQVSSPVHDSVVTYHLSNMSADMLAADVVAHWTQVLLELNAQGHL